MSASIWDQSSTIGSTANADGTYKAQRFVATAGQTLFTLTVFAYQIATGSSILEINGVAQFLTLDFLETSNTSFTLVTPAEVGDIVVFRGFIGGTAAVAAEGSAGASAASATNSAASAAAALASYNAILALSLPSLPLVIASGGTGQTTKAAAFLALAPTPVANKVIGSTDGVNFSMVPGASGTGGTTLTGNVTLTSASAASMVVTPTTPGLYATLPDATTCTKGISLFAIYNAGEYDYGIKNSTGTQLGWVRSQTGAVIGLADNAAAAGIWETAGVEKTGITAMYSNLTILSNQTPIYILVDANRTTFITSNGSAIYAITYDSSTQSWGALTLVRTVTSGTFYAALSGANQIVVVSCDATTAMETVTLTLAGTGITTNSAVPTTLAGNCTGGIGRVIAVSTSWVVSYGRATTTSAIRAITIAGTVPTVGAEVVVVSASGVVPPVLFSSGSICRTVHASATVLTCTPYTVVGSTATPGTAATATTTSATYRTFVNGNGNIIVEYVNNTHFASIFKLTGTVEAASSVTLGTAPTNGVIADSDYGVVTASKTVFTSRSNGAANYANILTDTAGTASAGVEIVALTANTSAYIPTFINSSGNLIRFIYGTAVKCQVTLNCSGTSATVSSVITYQDGIPVGVYSVSPGNNLGQRSGALLLAGTSSELLGQTIWQFRITPSSFILSKPLLMTNPMPQNDTSTHSDSWNYDTGTGSGFRHMEAAA